MGVQVYPFILPSLLERWGLSSSAAGLLASAALISGSLGGWIAGSLSDRFGRVRLLRTALLWLAASTVLCGLARTYEELLVARFLQGIGFGALWAVGIVFVSEMAPAATRGRVLGVLQSAWTFGWALAAGVTAMALAFLPPDLGWRVAFFASLFPALALYSTHGKIGEASRSPNEPPRSWHGIFAPDTLWLTLRGGLLATGAHGGYWALATWWPTMLRVERGLSAEEAWIHTVALIGGSFAGYALGAWLNDRVGRRGTLGGFALAGIVVATAATQFSLPDSALLAVTPLLGVCAMGIYSAVSPVLTELYPTSLRGSGLGFCYNVGRGLAGLAPLAVGTSVAALGYSHAIGLYVAVSYGLVLAAAAMLHETCGIELVQKQGA